MRCARLAVVLVALLPQLALTGPPGFASDDWELVELFTRAPDTSLTSLFAAGCNENELMRPVTILYRALLYRAFGLEPAGYHAATAVLLVLQALVLLALLRGVGLGERSAATAALLFASSPAYTSARYWWSAHVPIQASLLHLLGAWLLLGLGADATRSARVLRVTTSLLVTAAGVLSYETLLPLVPLNAWIAARSLPSATRRSARALLIALHVALALGLGGFKAATTVRLGNPDPASYGSWFAANLGRAVSVPATYERGLNYPVAFENAWLSSFGTLNLRLPGEIDTTCALLAMLALAISFAALSRIREHGSSRAGWGAIGWGVGVFVGGLAIFLTNEGIEHSLYGPGNRSAVTATLGTAVACAGLVSLAVGRLPAARQIGAHAAIVALLVGTQTLACAAVAGRWSQAARTRYRVLENLRADWPRPPARAALLLDGLCQYEGPAFVFEASWDWSAALRLHYGRGDVRGEVVTPRLRIEATGVVSTLYDVVRLLPYAGLHVYDARGRRVHAIPDPHAALAYFARHNPDYSSGCAPGRVGHGAPP